MLTVFLFEFFRNNPVQSVERTFQLTRADMDLVSKPEFDVEVGLDFLCMYNNAYPSMHWFSY